MDLPDCPPGAEGYQDSVTEVPKKLELEEPICTKAEQEFQEHLNSLKIRLEDGETRCMVERNGRDISGKWIYLCYPCAAVCSGESILQTHISGKKHKIKLTMRSVWPRSIYDDHPFNQNTTKTVATEKVLKRMAEEVDLHNRNPSELDKKYNKYRAVNCHIQDSLDAVKAPLIGVEYLIEHPPEQAHYEPTYMCTLCSKKGHPRTIINHMTCFWHRHNYLQRHFPIACGMLTPYRAQPKYREGVGVIMNRLAQRIEDKYGRKRPVNIDKEEYEKDKVQIHEWVFRGHHFSEKDGANFTEVVDIGLIDSLHKSNEESKARVMGKKKREPSPPIVAAPSRPLFNNFSDLDVVEHVESTTSTPVPEGSAGSGVRVKRVRSRKCPRSHKPKHLRLNPLAVQVTAASLSPQVRAAPLAPAVLPLPEPSIAVTTQTNTSLLPIVSDLDVDEVDLTGEPSVSGESGDEGAYKKQSVLQSPRCNSFVPPNPTTRPGPSKTVITQTRTSLSPVVSDLVVDVDEVDLTAEPSVSGESGDEGAYKKQSVVQSPQCNSFVPPNPTTRPEPSKTVSTQTNTSHLPAFSDLVVDVDQVYLTTTLPGPSATVTTQTNTPQDSPELDVYDTDSEEFSSLFGESERGGARQRRRFFRFLRRKSFDQPTPATLLGPYTTATTQKNMPLPLESPELVVDVNEVDLNEFPSSFGECERGEARQRRRFLRFQRHNSLDPPTPAALPGPSTTATTQKNIPLPLESPELVVDVNEVDLNEFPSSFGECERGGARQRRRFLRFQRHNSLDPPTPAALPGPSTTATTKKNIPLPLESPELVVDVSEVDLNEFPSSFGEIERGGACQRRRFLRFQRYNSLDPMTPATLPEPSATDPLKTPPPPVYSTLAAYRPAGRQERRAGSVESLSDISDEADHDHRRDLGSRHSRDRHDSFNKTRYEPYVDKRRGASPFRGRNARAQPRLGSQDKQQRPPNYDYKVKLAEEKRLSAEDSLKKTLAYHEKNPEKHPLYPEEWKKFWNRRYKEIQAEGKDPSKHDFKPEWIVFWTTRMKELHEEELRIQVNEIYRRLCLSPSDMSNRTSTESRLSAEKSRAPEPRRKSPELRRKTPEPRRKSPEPHRKSLEPRRRSPELRRRSPERRRLDRPDRIDRFDRPEYRGREPLPRRRSPPDFRRDRRSPPPHLRRSPGRRRSLERRRSPLPRHHRSRSRSPLHGRSPARTHISLESMRRSSRSPLSQREQQRNRSPDHATRQVAPSMQTVLISDDELKPDDGLSPWNSDNDIDSVGSGPETTRTDRSRADSMVSRSSKARRHPSVSSSQPVEGAADDVVAMLRQLVALEDYLGSLGPKIVDLLADALKMEKEKANSSEELLERESAVVLIETAKEKLKGAVQAGLVGAAAAPALRGAVVRAAAALHEADKRAKRKLKQTAAQSKTAAIPVAVAGVGEVDRAQIAQQMAEALIAQGKTDVSSEDLAVLVDAVVGMAEAKKRAAEQTKKVVAPPPADKPVVKPQLSKQSGTASALQMLQSAYDENDKKIEQSSAPDAMDGLSDSDLETLLKNFNELSAEEQHSLIAYLKKLEAKEPQRVERLRQYVSDAASTAPEKLTPEETEPEEPVKTLTIESDDDDYTVEEVFQSATQKVKEDQIRQEMEIVKKSLEETKVEPAVIEPTKLEKSLADITKSLSASSATDLFALVQASMKSTPAPTSAPQSQSANVVVSNTQPRSFGDLPEPVVTQELMKPLIQSASVTPMPLMSSFVNTTQGPGATLFQNQQGLLRLPVRFQQPQQQQQRPQQQQQQQQQQHQPQQQQQQQNYQSSNQNQQNYQSPQQNYPSPPQNQQQQQNYQPPQQNYQPPQQNQQQPLYNQGQQQQNYQPPSQHQQHNQLIPPHQQRNQPPHQLQFQPSHHQQQYQPPQHQQQHFTENRNKTNDHFNQGQWNARPNMLDNRGPPMRGPAPDNFGPNAPYNPRNNFMNGRGQDNYDTRPQVNQQFGNNNYDNQNNFRGRGGVRGNFGGPNRGRGRGYF